jgi:taurine dioxygenase
MSCEPEPPMGSILYMHQNPQVGGDTAFANMHLAYETLSEPIKRLCESLHALHTSAHVYSRGVYGRSDKKFPEAVHPVVRTHPVTKRRSLFVNRGFTTRIVELGKTESDSVLEMLLRHTETPEFQCRFRWARHSVAFWDNRCALHRATFDYHPEVRHGHRVTIRGDRPF